ncbi:MAG: LuxR C-terminal-related transcriptional regulator [Methylophagaceae bacterium]
MTKQLNYYRLNQLAHLGLPEQIFIPAFLQELHYEIPSISNSFCWQNNTESLCNIYDEKSNTKVIQDFIATVSNSASDKHSYTKEWVSELDKPTTSLENFGQCTFIAEFYKTVLLPLNYYNTCFTPVFSQENTTRLGILMIHRDKLNRHFSSEEIDSFSHISSLLSYGLSHVDNKPVHTIDGWEQGLLIVDEQGKLQDACTTGEKLISLASSSVFNSASSTIATNDIHIFDGLDQLIKTLLKSKKYHLPIADPTLTTSNAWGEFKLRGFLIKDKAGKRAPRIGLSIRWQEPFVLRIFHRIKTLGLTPRQETVGLFYAIGDQHQMIANKLNLSPYTVKEHIKNLTQRLNIHSRADFIELLLCDGVSE